MERERERGGGDKNVGVGRGLRRGAGAFYGSSVN